MNLTLIIKDAEYDDKGFCWVTNKDLKALLNQNGFEPVETGISKNNKLKFCKYQSKLTPEQLNGDFDQDLKKELVESHNRLNKLIAQWQDEQRNKKYSLDRWQINT
ncbi:hypothetical protein J7E73_10690 [Paenibacillus albidus]|uniref:hypothetical protein n=1 Tax=Paenibacillus albidus TaxID=2041023 RepID=UPI001BEAECC0|nr:hypothetical protein [Paenibacillus albidus]MBT2289591.1 hypothetical protein [Paenibacillus albidus]